MNIEDIKDRLSADYTSERYHDFAKEEQEDEAEISFTLNIDDIDSLFGR